MVWRFMQERLTVQRSMHETPHGERDGRRSPAGAAQVVAFLARKSPLAALRARNATN
jgi:hypothetical protein